MSGAKHLRERAVEDPRSVVSDIDELDRYLRSGDSTTTRHAVEAARKVAYVAPQEMRRCKEPLADLANHGYGTGVRKSACFALGYIGRVDDEARQLLAEPQRTGNDEVREAAAKARNSIARESVGGVAGSPPSGGTGTDTELYPDPDGAATGTGTDVYPDEGTGRTETEIYGGEPDTATTDEGPQFCSDCGTSLQGHGSPNYCPGCGTEVRGPTSCPACGEPVTADDRYCSHCGWEL